MQFHFDFKLVSTALKYALNHLLYILFLIGFWWYKTSLLKAFINYENNISRPHDGIKFLAK